MTVPSALRSARRLLIRLAAGFVVLAAMLPVAGAAHAQSCDRALETAETQYVAGRFDTVIAGLDACLERGAFSRTERERAYRLIGLSYIGKDLRDEARRAIEMLLQLVPDYRPDPVDDPPPFVQLVEELRQDAPPRPPVVAGTFGDVTLRPGGRAVEHDLRSLFEHPGGAALTYSARVEAPAIAHVDVAGSLLTVEPRTPGRTRLLLTAREPSGLEATHTVDLRVEEALTETRSRRGMGRWLLIGGGILAGGVAAAVLAGGGSDGETDGGGPIGGPPPLPGLR